MTKLLVGLMLVLVGLAFSAPWIPAFMHGVPMFAGAASALAGLIEIERDSREPR